jgi:type IV fimbrial biogenesis protein FimT
MHHVHSLDHFIFNCVFIGAITNTQSKYCRKIVRIMKTTSFQKQFRSKRGVSTMELIVVVVIIGVLSALAFPEFSMFLHKHRAATLANEFITDVNLARSEAISRGTRVTMCKSADGGSCTSDNHWDQGWIVFEESVTINGVREAGEEIVKVRGRLEGASSLKGNALLEDYISFLPTGFTRRFDGGLQPGTIKLESRGHAINLVVNSAGRVRMDKL